MDERLKTHNSGKEDKMLIDQSVTNDVSLEDNYLMQATDHKFQPRDIVRNQEPSLGELQTAVENLQDLVSELLMRNQILRMALERSGEPKESLRLMDPLRSRTRRPSVITQKRPSM